MTVGSQNLSLVENAKPSHFNSHCKLEVEGLGKGPREFVWITNLCGVLHGIQWIKSYDLLDFASSSRFSRGGSYKELGDYDISKS